MKLTDEQSQKVEKNHKLIYWYAKIKGLDIEEWYGSLAVELCLTVVDHNIKKGSLSNYFKVRADNMVNKEYAKQNSQKRKNNGIVSLDNHIVVCPNDDIMTILELNEAFDMTNDVLRLKSMGYTQGEIAEELGISQPKISKYLKKLKEDYFDGQND